MTVGMSESRDKILSEIESVSKLMRMRSRPNPKLTFISSNPEAQSWFNRFADISVYDLSGELVPKTDTKNEKN